MDAAQSQHLARLRHLRESFAEANERLVARLRNAPDEAVRQPADGGWSAAQIGWHVAAVTTRFARLMSGDMEAAQPLPTDFRERKWDEIAANVPPRLTASAAVAPPAVVSKSEAIAALESSATKMARALDTLTAERGGRMGITHPIVGTINLYQLGDWATAHVIRHNRQAKRVLGEG
jgi:hypothetical protein